MTTATTYADDLLAAPVRFSLGLDALIDLTRAQDDLRARLKALGDPKLPRLRDKVPLPHADLWAWTSPPSRQWLENLDEALLYWRCAGLFDGHEIVIADDAQYESPTWHVTVRRAGRVSKPMLVSEQLFQRLGIFDSHPWFMCTELERWLNSA